MIKSGIVPYVGSKAKLSKRIIELMPQHSSYIEPFFGSGAVFFNKKQVKHELINDLDNNIYLFLLYLKYHKKELVSEIENYANSQQLYKDIHSDKLQIPTELHRVAMWYLEKIMTFRGSGSVSFNLSSSNTRNVIQNERISKASEYLEYYANRVKNACISNTDAFNILESGFKKNTMIYIDPPYHFEKNHNLEYYDKGNEFTDFKTHERLKNVIDDLTDKEIFVICSYADNLKIKELYNDNTRYKIIEIDYYSSVPKERPKYKELLILNYKPYQQIRLFEDDNTSSFQIKLKNE